jgi:8-oxo-dGTP diphosphatase
MLFCLGAVLFVCYTIHMPHIHNNFGEHDFTASAFVIRDDLDEPQLLLHMHKKLHVLLQFGGHVELSENPWQAIEHELREESGYAFEELEVLQPKDRMHNLSGVSLHPTPVVLNTHPFNKEGSHYHIDIPFAFLAHGEPSQAPAVGESNDVRWFTYKQLTDLGSNEIPENVREIGLYVLTDVYKKWERKSAKLF